VGETHETKLLPVGEVARRCGVSRPTIYRRISESWLRALRIGDGSGPDPRS